LFYYNDDVREKIPIKISAKEKYAKEKYKEKDFLETP
jgi:hypothetical protein